MGLAKRERKRLNSGIEEFDLESPVFCATLLSDELIEARLANFAGTVRGRIGPTIGARGGAIQSHLKTTAVLQL
jgi:hypothetical protein